MVCGRHSFILMAYWPTSPVAVAVVCYWLFLVVILYEALCSLKTVVSFFRYVICRTFCKNDCWTFVELLRTFANHRLSMWLVRGDRPPEVATGATEVIQLVADHKTGSLSLLDQLGLVDLQNLWWSLGPRGSPSIGIWFTGIPWSCPGGTWRSCRAHATSS